MAAFEQLPINSNLTELIDEHGQALARLTQQLAQHRGLAGAKKTGDHGHRQARCRRHDQATIIDQLKAQPMPIKMPAASRKP